MTDRPCRAMSDAEVFAALAALPEHLCFSVSRYTERSPDPELMALGVSPPTPAALTKEAEKAWYEARERSLEESVRDRVFWTVSLRTTAYGQGFEARGPRLADAYLEVRRQITAFTEALLPPSQS